ncbi:MAG: hypothetical protein HKN70_11890, partial [Gammaproteobacteria bacterium]|nr:hypothetical protein [Gammaproteobacteria bacterium]
MSHTPWQPDAVPSSLSPAQVAAKFRKLIASGCRVLPAGNAKPNPLQLLRGYLPKHLLTLFGHRYFLTNVRHDNQFRFFVAYVQLATRSSPSPNPALYPRIFYKDSSLIWRVATHYINSPREHWIGKGDIKPVQESGHTHWYSAEETTNLPFEIQNALDAISRRVNQTRADRRALSLILRNAPDDRVKPYADFSRPRQSAMAAPDKRVYNNLPIAWFTRPNDPRSLQFAPGYAPDFLHGFISGSESRSRLYGGRIQRFRIAAQNREIQYLFKRAPQISWIIPPQTLDDSIFSYGVR